MAATKGELNPLHISPPASSYPTDFKFRDMVRKGRAVYREYIPTGLRQYVNRFWFLEYASPNGYEKILPVPFAYLTVNLSEEPYRLYMPGSSVAHKILPNDTLAGLRSSYKIITPPRHVRVIGAEFKPFALRAFIRRGLSADEVISVGEALPGTSKLHEHLLAGKGADEQFKIMEEYLESSFTPLPKQILAKLEGLHDAFAKVARNKLGHVPRAFNLSKKTVIALTHQYSGTTPKVIADIYTFQRVISLIHEAKGNPNWAEIAAELNYSDQPHFSKAFKSFAGFTPKEYTDVIARFNSAATNYVALDANHKR